MREPQNNSVVISFLRGMPGPALVSLFKQSFPRHPASSLNDELAGAFLSAFALRGIFLVARDSVTGEELGFAVGGEAGVLDRTRRRFIRDHALHIASSVLFGRLSPRALVARMRGRPKIHHVLHAPYQMRFIAVNPYARGAGAGTLLLNAFERALPSRAAYHAWTLEGPNGAEGFYLANGFRRDIAFNGHLRMWKRV
jgi:GNAT superfamily N-acetyltransferase